MKIKRNGVEYELTKDELYAAFQERQHLDDVLNIDLNLRFYLSAEDFEKVKGSKEFLDDAAYTLRSNLDDLDMDFDVAVEKAIEYTLDCFVAHERAESAVSDKVFYSIEQGNDCKKIHVFGEIYYLGNGEENDYCFTQFTGVFLDFEDVQKSGGKLLEYIYNNGERVYEQNITSAEAEECCKTYFNGKTGTKLDIYECDEDTPCGDYWCDI